MESIVSSIKRVVNMSIRNGCRGGVEITRNAHMRIENKIKHTRHSTYMCKKIFSLKQTKGINDYEYEGGEECREDFTRICFN
jgi:hypothetical protein